MSRGSLSYKCSIYSASGAEPDCEARGALAVEKQGLRYLLMVGPVPRRRRSRLHRGYLLAGPGGLGVLGESVRYLRRHGSRMRLGLNVRVHAQVPLLLWGPDTCYSRGKWGPGLTPRWYPDVSRETMTSATSTWSDSPRPSLAPDAFLSSGVSRETPDGIAPQCPRGTVTSFLTEIQGNRGDSLLTQGDVAHGITQVTAGEGQPAPYVGWDRAWFTRRPGPLAAS